ncbi:MAG: hypothetical protein QME60_07105 [Verrucomicrobiota bacterium]|nr:hypothetical protein [Verrucomicrobiota bacterium]
MKKIGLGVVMLALVSGGCLDSETPPAAPPAEALRAQARDLMRQGKTNEVIFVLDQAMSRDELSAARPAILRELLTILLMSDDVPKAQEKFLAVAAGGDKRTPQEAFGMIESYLAQHSRHAELATWCDTLLARNLGDPIAGSVADRLLQAQMADGKMDQALKTLAGLPVRLSGAAASQVVERLLESFFQAWKQTEIEQALGVVEKPPLKDLPGLAATAAAFRIRLLARASKLDDAERALLQSLDMLGDSRAGWLLGQVVGLARQGKNLKKADELCLKILAMEKAGAVLVRAAAEHALTVARDMDDPDQAFARLKQVLRRVTEPAAQLRLARQVVYFIMEKNKKETLTQLRDLCEQIVGKLQGDRNKSDGNTILLDIYFMTGDFDKALRVAAEAGNEESERDMNDMLLIKIRAHKALAEGNKAEAVALFARFMEAIKKMDEIRVSAEDPMTKLRVSKDEVLGLNAARIGRLWSELGENDKAAAAFVEAKRRYEEALKRAAQGSRERQAIEQALKDMAK